jgi:L-fuconolactonase
MRVQHSESRLQMQTGSQQMNEPNASVGTIDPGLAIIDSHHHLWHPHAQRYYTDAFQADIAASGHDVRATVYVEGGAMHRRRGPESHRPVGEAEFVAGMAAMSDSGVFGTTRICAAFVGAADLTLGASVDDVLDAMAVASGGRLRGIRGSTIWDADESVNTGTRPMAPRGLMLDPRYCAGVARLAARGLSYDAWHYFPQLPDLCGLAEAVPNAKIVVNHCGGLLGIGPYARPDNFEHWKKLMSEAARRSNVFMKLGGLAGGRTGFGYADRAARPRAEDLAQDWRPYIETCIELFGTERCLFESNFPVDRVAGDYRTLWNAFKLITSGCSTAEKSLLFCANAQRIYGIDLKS